jgi:hypothetical protein
LPITTIITLEQTEDVEDELLNKQRIRSITVEQAALATAAAAAGNEQEQDRVSSSDYNTYLLALEHEVDELKIELQKEKVKVGPSVQACLRIITRIEKGDDFADCIAHADEVINPFTVKYDGGKSGGGCCTIA